MNHGLPRFRTGDIVSTATVPRRVIKRLIGPVETPFGPTWAYETCFAGADGARYRGVVHEWRMTPVRPYGWRLRLRNLITAPG